MKLHDRDYNSLTTDEEAQWRLLQEQEVVDKLGTMPIIRSRFREYPKAARHFTALFPNNYLDIVELKTGLLQSFKRHWKNRQFRV